MDLSQIATIALASAGGSALVVGGLARWVGRVWADRIVEQQKASNARALEEFKSSLEMMRLQERRNSEALFQLYTDVWRHLVDLQSIGEQLWEHASRQHLEMFVGMLRSAQIAANRGRLILPEAQYRRLQALFEAFDAFQFGKLRLIELGSEHQFDELFRMESETSIREQIRRNGKSKDDYKTLIEEILLGFRSQLGLPPNQALHPTAGVASTGRR